MTETADQLVYALALIGLGFLMAVSAQEMNPPTPRTIFVPQAGLQVDCRETKWICHQRKISARVTK